MKVGKAMTKKPLRAEPTPEPEWPEHPEDRALRLQSEAQAAKAIADFAARHAPELAALVQVYADTTAHERLDALRELFWTSLPFDEAQEKDPRE